MRILVLLLLSIASFGQINSPTGFLNYAKKSRPTAIPPVPYVDPLVPTVAWYKFQETTGNAIDEINAYNGTVSGPTRDGIRYSFDGVDDYVTLNPALNDMKLTNVGTISFRAKPPLAAPGATETILSFNDISGGTYLTIGYNEFLSGRLRVKFSNAYSDKWQLETDANITTNNTDVLVTLVHTGATSIIYINGIAPAQTFSTSTDLTWWLNSSSADLDNITVGAEENSGGARARFFEGGVRDIKLWDTALTAAEVRELAGIPTPAELGFYKDNITVADGSANAVIKLPSTVDSPPADGWPLIVFFGGDGTSGNTTTTVSNQAMSTGDDITYTHSPTLGGADYRIMSTVIIKADGETVGKGTIGGTITGATISSGSITNLNTNTPTVTVVFSSAQTGKVITYDFIHSTMMLEGPARLVNLGDDLDDKCILIVIQNVQSTTDFDADYFDKAVEYAWDNYTINRNRIYMAGISRGGRGILDSPGIIKTRYVFWINESTGVISATDLGAGYVSSGIASVVVGTASYGTHTAINYTDIGFAAVHGTGDGVLTNTTYTFAASLEANNEPPYILNAQGYGHNAGVWDDRCYDRKYRSGGGLAEWDYLDFLLRYSKNAEERATLFVDQVEKRRYNTEKDIIDYRHAARQVAALGAGAVKTALEGRLTTVKSAIDGAGTRWVLNPHSAGNDETGNYIDLGTATSGTTYTDMVNFDGGASTLDFVYTTASGGSNATITSSRRSLTGGFSKIANNSGVLITSTVGTFGFTNVPAGTYTMRIYHNEGTGNFTNDATLKVVAAFTTKTQYSAINSLLGFVEFTGLAAGDLTSFTVERNSTRDTYITIIELYKNP